MLYAWTGRSMSATIGSAWKQKEGITWKQKKIKNNLMLPGVNNILLQRLHPW